jgi:serine/threonine protein kinase/ribosomal protein S27E
MIAFACPGCARRLQVQEDFAGKKVRCPACGKPIAVPGAGGERARVLAGPGNRSPAPGTRAAGGEEQTLSPRAPSAAETSTATPERSSSGQTSAEIDPGGRAPAGELTAFLAPPQQPDEIGRLGPYRVLKVLGHGGMGVVFQAEDPGLRRPVALKAMLPALAVSASARERFFREARSAAALLHPHIVTIFQVGEDRGVPFLAMQFLEGESLDERIQREEKLPVAEVLRIGREVALGLACAHAKGLIHRDVKPANVWLEAPPSPLSPGGRGVGGEGDNVKLLDFGLARALADDVHLTQSGAIVGTPAYMAPEQARGEVVNHRADLFSLGCLLYRLCVGKLPFRGDSTLAILTALAVETPPEPSSVNPDVPPELSALIVQLLQKDPKQRPVSAAAVAEVLQGLQKRLLQEQEAQAETVSLPAAPQGKAASGTRRRLALRCGMVAVLAGLLAIGLWAAGVFRVASGPGDLVLESDDPDFAFAVDKGGGVRLEDRKVKRTYAVRAVPVGKDEYELEVLDKDTDLAFKTRTFTVKRGDKVALRAWFERKPQEKAGGTLSDEEWFRHVDGLPLEVQVAAVVARLKERNPGFDGKVNHKIEDGGSVVSFPGDEVTDLTPLRTIRGLRWLECAGSYAGRGKLADLSPLKGLKLEGLGIWNTKVSDLSPLKGMPLTMLNCGEKWVTDLSPLKGLPLKSLFLAGCSVSDLTPLIGMPLRALDCQFTQVSDLSPLRDMPLTWLKCAHTPIADLSPLKSKKLYLLSCQNTKVTDLSVLRGMPLVELWCDFKPERDAEVLRSLQTLKKINGKPAAELWKEVDSGSPRKKP